MPPPHSSAVRPASTVPPSAKPRPKATRGRRAPRRERPIDEAQHRIGQQVGRIAVARAALVVDEQPAQVGVHEAAQRPRRRRRDRRAGMGSPGIGERVVLAMIGDQEITGPSIAAEPSTARTARTRAARLGRCDG